MYGWYDDIVSIHAPREGCDEAYIRVVYRLIVFQFTHPGRGATPCIGTCRLSDDVSIHAPREGCDDRAITNITNPISFNSRTPGGVRRACCLPRYLPLMFQFTHPGRGATASGDACRRRYDVSIHAPREGCDGQDVEKTCEIAGFNSRTPGGVRQSGHAYFPSLSSFNSRTPGGVRHKCAKAGRIL